MEIQPDLHKENGGVETGVGTGWNANNKFYAWGEVSWLEMDHR